MPGIMNLFCSSQTGKFSFHWLNLEVNTALSSLKVEAESKENISEYLYLFPSSTVIFNWTHFPTSLASRFAHVIKFWTME